MTRACNNMDAALAWVAQYKPLIRQKIVKFLPYSSYDEDDFMQSAYESVCYAVELSHKRQCENFTFYFWRRFLKLCCQQSDLPSKKFFFGKAIGSEKAEGPCEFDSYQECYDEGGETTPTPVCVPNPEDAIIENLIDKLVPIRQQALATAVEIALQSMTERQREIVTLDLSGSGNVSEMASQLKVTRQTVQIIKKQAYARLEKLMKKDPRRQYREGLRLIGRA